MMADRSQQAQWRSTLKDFQSTMADRAADSYSLDRLRETVTIRPGLSKSRPMSAPFIVEPLTPIAVSTLTDTESQTLRERALLDAVPDASCFTGPRTAGSRIGAQTLSRSWAEELERTKEQAMRSLPTKLQLECHQSSRPVSAASVRLPLDSIERNIKDDDSECTWYSADERIVSQLTQTLKILEAESPEDSVVKTVFQNNEEVNARRNPALYRLSVFKEFLSNFGDKYQGFHDMIEAVMTEYDLALSQVQQELDAERAHPDYKPSKNIAKETLREKILDLTAVVQKQEKEMERQQAIIKELQKEKYELSLKNATLEREGSIIKAAIKQSSHILYPEMYGQPGDFGLSEKVFQEIPPTYDQAKAEVGNVPGDDMSYLMCAELVAQIAESAYNNKQKVTLLETESAHLQGAVKQSEVDSDELYRKFDRLATVYESQHEELGVAKARLRAARYDLSRAAEIKKRWRWHENKMAQMEVERGLILRELKASLDIQWALLAKRGLADFQHIPGSFDGDNEAENQGYSLMRGKVKKPSEGGSIGDQCENFLPLSGANVPEYLADHNDQPITNLHLGIDDVYKITKEVLKGIDTAESFQKHIVGVIQSKYPGKPVSETMYSFLDTCYQYAPDDPISWMMYCLLRGHLPESFPGKFNKEIQRLKAMLEEAVVSTLKEGPMPLSDFFAVLEEAFPQKSQEQHLQLRTLVLVSTGFKKDLTHQVYTELVATSYGKSIFIDELRRQFILEYDQYSHQLVQCLIKYHETLSLDAILSYGDIANAFLEVDPGIPEDEVLRRLRIVDPKKQKKPKSKRLEAMPEPKMDFSQKISIRSLLTILSQKCYLRPFGSRPSFLYLYGLHSDKNNSKKEEEVVEATDDMGSLADGFMGGVADDISIASGRSGRSAV